MSEWEWKTLGDIASEGYGLVDGPFGSNLPASCYVESGIPVIRGSNLTLGSERFVANEFVYVSEETAQSLERSLARPNDIIFTKKGTIGQTGLVHSNLQHDVYLISSNQMKLTVDESIADPIFVYYYVSSKSSQNKIKRDSEFTGVPKTNIKYLREFPIYLPSLPQQKQIARTLDSLDRKIENLRRQNETLEAIAQTLFKHWFVDFEFPNADGKPYKSSGGAMEPSELGEIPAGWRVCAMEDVIEVRDGTHDSPKQTEEGFHLITSKHLKKSGIDFDSAYLISEYDYIEVNKRSRVDTYDILLSMIGTVGILYFVMDKEIKFAIKNIGLFKSSQNLDYAEYIFLFLDSIYGITYFRTRLAGTTQSYLTLGSLREMPLIVPIKSVLLHFKEIVNVIFDKIYVNNQQIQTLTKTRDVLLPKLMSGKLRIKP